MPSLFVEHWVCLMRFWMNIDKGLQCSDIRDALGFATD
jgi:hypothetical protein